MPNTHLNWRWEDGVVDEQEEHIELRHGNARETPYEDWKPLARIAKPKQRVFIVEWLVKQDSPENQAMLADARLELNFYLVEKVEPDPWAYAIYHCNTGANMYSPVHWSYFQAGIQSTQYASKVLDLSSEESKKLFGDAREPGKYILKR